MNSKLKWLAISGILLLSVTPFKKILAFCGFYVAKADASLYNKASRVAVVRNQDRTVISMMNDFQGDLKDFAIVVPVPVILEKDQIHVGDSKIMDHLDAYSAPRLVEYFDPDPCYVYEEEKSLMDVFRKKEMNRPVPSSNTAGKKDLGVTVEASYTIGEYDIQILSAKYSDGLETWLNQNGYKIPKGASEALKPYIQQKLKFFVAKVNLKSIAQGLTFLRPLQFAFESPKFMLPIRLGMLNAKGEQDLLLYMLSKEGRVETTNYRTVKLPSDLEVPEFVKSDFANFYKAMFTEQARKENHRVVFTEYFWNMSWCDPCAAEPLSNQELEQLGVFWLGDNGKQKQNWGGAPQVMITRLHLRYNNDTFPEDLVFQETKDQTNFQGRYIIQHPWKGSPNQCSQAKEYFKQLRVREEQRAENYRTLTGLDIKEIRGRMKLQEEPKEEDKWWKKIWK
ncbi:MAG TPA: DUF2330 domain-containing protein [Leptospiraceae bacterium]|nr:DUF2330 domain-containing protein [Leptospiraceae bacterium]HMX31949.1 DUF2330 domain-containing protein [Leptospiraceae bacterium]HMY33620.1 DUF2330 domain-containing protein [Leptospiraceae bacterium]HMZ66452.1 DUF2330 domain-containing protein [Leptospiraceae bacterium]HNA05317.1 DUF2330 domain-containing protein [Leptospiraceae bacterium]